MRLSPLPYFVLFSLMAISPALQAAPDNNQAIWQYQVKAGDSLWTFADQHLSSPAYVPRLQNLNHIADPYHLRPGSVIKVPYLWVRQHASTAQIEEFSGDVTAHDAQGKELAVNKDMRYAKGAQFQTGNDSMLKLRFEDGSTLLLNANSSAQLQTEIYYPSTGSARTEIKLDKGNAGSSVIPNILMPNRYQIRTPSAITTVRGTEFRVGTETDTGTTTEVLRGKVNVVNNHRQDVDVPAGYGTLAQANARPTAPEAIPVAPDLSSLPEQSLFNPPLLQWQADPTAAAYRVRLRGPGEHGKLLTERNLASPQLFPQLPANGEYQLTARTRNAHGLEGYDSSKTFRLKAFPAPPLLQATAGTLEIRSSSLTLHLPANPEHPLLLQLARQADFGDAKNMTITTADYNLQLEDKGSWYWRVARLSDQGQAGPFSDSQHIETKGLFSRLSDSKPALLGRRYPLDSARYTLTLADNPQMQHANYHDSRAQPVWLLEQLPHGKYFARLEISNDGGYHAVETTEEINIP